MVTVGLSKWNNTLKLKQRCLLEVYSDTDEMHTCPDHDHYMITMQILLYFQAGIRPTYTFVTLFIFLPVR